jgi:PAS domain S-box-containing protein
LFQAGGARPLNCAVVARIAKERLPVLIENTADQPGQVDLESARSYVGAPLMAGASFVGALELFSDQTGVFSPMTLETVRVVAIYTAIVYENTRLYRETLLRADEVDTLNTLAAILTASLNPDQLLESIVYTVDQAIGCDRAAIFVMDSERGVLNLAKAKGLSQEYIRSSQNLNPRMGGRAQVVLDRYPIIVNDVRQSKVLPELLAVAEQEGFRAFADFPLRGREHVLGALTVYYDQPHIFDEAEMDRLRTFVNQVTLALENARLYERTDRALARRVSQLAAIEEIGRELTSTLDVNRIFNMVLERTMGMTGASAGLLAVCNPVCDHLDLITQRGYPQGSLQQYQRDGWPLDRGIVGRVARTGEKALLNDVRVDPDYTPRLADTSAQLTVPIVKEGRVLGVVSLESNRPQGFSPDDERFTIQLAELAAIAIDNARLFQQVTEGRDNLQAILDSTRDGVIVTDREARIVLANPMIEEMSGFSAQQLVGRWVREVLDELGLQMATTLGLPLREQEQALALLSIVSDGVERFTFELAGSPARYIEQTASPVKDKDGAVVGRLFVFRDITEERRLSQMRQDLTDMIIHDLRSPLTAVVGGVQFASDLIDAEKDTAMVKHSLEMADQSCARLMTLVDSLLDISRLESGQMPLERQPVQLPQLAQSVIQQMTSLAEKELVTLHLQTMPQIPLVDVDADLVSRVLVNLVDNALKHSPRQGVVTIKIAPEPDETPGQPAQYVECTVLDMGPGIPDESRQRVFERFAQLDGRRRGKGLGLAFCKLAVQAHGGRIWIDDNPRGRGSAIHFTVPVIRPVMMSAMDFTSLE